MRFTTRAIHGGFPKDPQSKAVTFPIYQTSTFSQEHPGEPVEFMGRALSYARTENPTRTALEASLAELEEARYGLAYPTGLAAVTCVMNTLNAGDHVIACSDLYGGCYRMFTKVYSRHGIEFSFVDATDLTTLASAFRENTRLVWLESPSNPLLNVTDLAAASAIARERGATSIVDNTFATPYLQRPLELGADVVLHSTTKYINGHADVVGGALLTNSDELYQRLKFVQNACGLVPAPQDCFLINRGLRTLALRMERHCDNAEKVAEFLSQHDKVERVYYPGLATHCGHGIAKKQMKRFGAMLSFDLKADVEKSKRFAASLKYFTLAESLGAIQSLICHPPTMTHASVEPDVRKSVGISDGLIRISVGLEDPEDLIEDLGEALSAL
ncbi:PLP-dependent transferase [Fimbriimonadia bacterium ATM]|nr:MAG: PLP-dependent transferase [Armatimonadota bacterium]MBC6969788.1 PLP-dependent transferase [Armatimonadota bacterium]MCE7899056.1 PLP-dependent transferase [Armatimonadetes bacterium ATM1]MDL1927511.1 PLP-dependent transferase [Fimbriimonadia bacterium ATM]RIJ95997.1 MAG: cystathionine gamma-synthase [Armatimonadota bacterium]